MRILVTGATGFAGGHLLELLLRSPDAEILAVGRHPEWPAELHHLADRVELAGFEVNDQARWLEILQRFAPQQIYHLAGIADVGQSYQNRRETWQVNFDGTLALYEAAVQTGCTARIVFVGSGLSYGIPPSDNHEFTEESPFYPSHPYAASKAAADLLSYQYACHPGLNIVRARPFNHIGPRQSARFAVANFARQIAAIEQNKQQPVLETGNLDTFRDLTDVRDIVRAYVMLMERGKSGRAYNIASGNVYRIRDILHRLIALGGRQVEIVQRSDLKRTSEPPTMRASIQRIRNEIGWQPVKSLEESLAEVLEFWRKVCA